MAATLIGTTPEGIVIYSGSEAERLAMTAAKIGTIFLQTGGNKYEADGSGGWNPISIAGAELVVVSNSLISYSWAGAGTTAAPSPAAFADFVVGVNQGGGATGNVYHVISGAWVDTGATVKNLYGGA